MDKQTVIGFVLIMLILVGFNFLNKPTAAQLEEARRQDSIAQVERLKVLNAAAMEEAMAMQQAAAEASVDTVALKALQQSERIRRFGMLAPLSEGENTHYTFSNEVMELTMASKGGRIGTVLLKDYVTGDSLPLYLFDENESLFSLTFITNDSRIIETKDLYFRHVDTGNPAEFVFRLPLTEENYLDFVYTLAENDYMLHFDVRGNGLANILTPGTNSIDLNWQVRMRSQEKGRKFENRYSMLQYKYLEDKDVEKLSEAKDQEKRVASRLNWVSFKDQFFAAVLISDKGLTSNVVASTAEPEWSPYIKNYSLQSSAEFNLRGDSQANFRFYFGPSKYQILKDYDKGVDKEAKMHLDRIVPLGGKLIRWVSTLLILPLFKFFGGFISNYGVIIMLMTLCIKLLIFPLTYKSYMSSAKMRALKPELDAINAKYPGDSKAAERSQATMEFYKKAGVSPAGGCLPMLLQFPVLIAMFWFFPASIELRQQSFLWAPDLSTYDALISWEADIPLIKGLFGHHISLFCLLMTITNILSTKITSGDTSGQQMPGMKMMMYLMPVMFFFMFNNYASGLSFYYFFSSLLSIGQTLLFRAFTDEEKLRAQIQLNVAKPQKKSAFQKRLEEAQRMQREQAKANAKKNLRR